MVSCRNPFCFRTGNLGLPLIIFGIGLALNSFSSSTQVLIAQQTGKGTDENQLQNLAVMSSTLAWEAMEVIQNKHVNPPLRNQMILGGVSRLFPEQRRKLYDDISKIQSKDELESLLKKALSKRASDAVQEGNRSGHRNETNGPTIRLNDPVSIANAFCASVEGAPQLVTTYQSRINKQLAENRYVGIGIALSKVGKYTNISAAFRGGPAQKAGVINNDQILKVDNVSMVGKPLGEVVMALRGPKGSEVDVVVSQAGKPERSYRITRGVVPISSVKGVAEKGEVDWDFRIPGRDGVAYVEILDITGSTAAELRTALRIIEREAFEAIVLDFRNCFRADLHHMLMVADTLVEANELGSWVDASGKATSMKIRPTSQLGNIPLSLIASPSQANEVKILIQSLVSLRNAKLVGRLNPAEPRIRQNVPLPSGVGTLENLMIGTVRLNATVPAGLGSSVQNDRFRTGTKSIDAQIEQAAGILKSGG